MQPSSCTIPREISAGKCDKVRRVVYANDGIEQMHPALIQQTRSSD